MLLVRYRDLRHPITTKKPTSQFLHFNQNPHLKFISKIPQSSTNHPSFTVDYLVNSCGLPPEKALSAANKLKLCSIEKADSVISLFQSLGLTETHITEIISQQPQLLTLDPNKTLKPKIEFFNDLGLSGQDISKCLTFNSAFLSSSLQNQIIPSFNFLKSYLGTTANILIVLKGCPRLFQYNLEKQMIPKISILQTHGVPHCNIRKLFIGKPGTLAYSNERFKEIVEMVKKMGFDPLSPMFTEAVRTVTGMSTSSWENKLLVYQEFGLAESDVISMFKKQPCCMKLSEKKIRKVMGFFREKLKLKPTDISFYPTLLLYSLEKRIIPRCAVLKILYSEGIVRKKLSLGSVCVMSERLFLKMFVTMYQETVPEVMEAYKGGIQFEGFGEVVEVKKLYLVPVIDHITPVVTAT